MFRQLLRLLNGPHRKPSKMTMGSIGKVSTRKAHTKGLPEISDHLLIGTRSCPPSPELYRQLQHPKLSRCQLELADRQLELSRRQMRHEVLLYRYLYSHHCNLYCSDD
jgi:hypothetical protein